MSIRFGNRRSLGRIINVIARSFRDSVVTTIKKKKPYLSLTVDAASDKQNKQFLLVYLQFVVDMKVHVKNYATILLESKTAEAMQQAILSKFEEDGIQDIVKEKLLALISDGASNMHGVRGGLGARMNTWVHAESFNSVVRSVNRPALFTIHCISPN